MGTPGWNIDNTSVLIIQVQHWQAYEKNHMVWGITTAIGISLFLIFRLLGYPTMRRLEPHTILFKW